jgi:hypothetical protein
MEHLKIGDLRKSGIHFFYYEEINRELNRILIHECRCDERLRPKTEGSTCLTYIGLCGIVRIHWVVWNHIDWVFLFIISRQNER